MHRVMKSTIFRVAPTLLFSVQDLAAV